MPGDQSHRKNPATDADSEFIFKTLLFPKNTKWPEKGCQLKMTPTELANPLVELEGSSPQILIITYPLCHISIIALLTIFLRLGYFLFYNFSFICQQDKTSLGFPSHSQLSLKPLGMTTHLTLDLRRQSTRTVCQCYWGC